MVLSACLVAEAPMILPASKVPAFGADCFSGAVFLSFLGILGGYATH